MAISAVLCFHGFEYGGTFLSLGFTLTVGVMGLWFKDVITEGRTKSSNIVASQSDNPIISGDLTFQSKLNSKNLNKKVSLQKKDISKYVDLESPIFQLNDEELGYYLAGLIEGDGDIYLPSLGKTTLNRVLNPRINFTSHINNLFLYATIQSRLGDIGRFQKREGNVLRYIIGDVEGIKKIILLTRNKYRTPKNERFNQLIQFMNKKYLLNNHQSILDQSNILENS
jgi:hypothetical protein